MNIIGGKLTRVSAEKYVQDVQQTSLSINIVIRDVQLKGKTLFLKYTYEIDYKEKQARMEFDGEVHMQDSDKVMKEFEEKWKKNKQIDPQYAEQLLNSVTYTGMAVGSLLSFAVGVPAPLTVQKFKVDTIPGKAG